MKIALIISPLLFKRCPLIGLAYLTAYLKARGFEVTIFDLNVEMKIANDTQEEIWSEKSFVDDFILENYSLLSYFADRILQSGAEIVGFSIWKTTKYTSLALADMIKQKDKDRLIVFGGPECSFIGEELILKESVDIVAYGEGEETLGQIAQLYQRQRKIDFCPGTLLKRDGGIFNCGYRDEIKNLDTLPFPDYSDFLIQRYYLPHSLPIMFNRGCWRRCVFCNASISWRKFRSRSAENLYKEIVFQTENNPELKKFEVDDTALNLNLLELSKLCDLIVSHGLRVDWGGSAIIHPEMDFIFLQKMSQAGCSSLAYGLESGSQKVLDSMRKGFRIEDAQRLIRDTYKAGIEVILNIVIGFPNETDYDFQQTMDFIKSNREFISYISYPSECHIGDNTHIYNHPEEFGINNHKNRFWQSQDGANNHKERQGRIEIFNEFICSLGLSLRNYKNLSREVQQS